MTTERRRPAKLPAWPVAAGTAGTFLAALAFLAGQVRDARDPALGPAEPVAAARAPQEVVVRRIIRRLRPLPPRAWALCACPWHADQAQGGWRRRSPPPRRTAAHHLLDPATGEPAWTGVVTATAVAPTAVEAEARAKAASRPESESGAAAAEGVAV